MVLLSQDEARVKFDAAVETMREQIRLAGACGALSVLCAALTLETKAPDDGDRSFTIYTLRRLTAFHEYLGQMVDRSLASHGN